MTEAQGVEFLAVAGNLLLAVQWLFRLSLAIALFAIVRTVYSLVRR